LKDRSNPYQKEVDTCDHLIAFCNKLKVIHGLINPAHEDITQSSATQKVATTEPAKKLNEAKFERSQTKAEREQEALIQVGGGKNKKKGKKPKKA
jgi:hypothetical protein